MSDDQRREPPALRGTLLGEVRCRRRVEKDGPEREGVLRVVLDEYEGRPFLSVRFWALDAEGQAWPTRTGLTIRVRELGAVLEALQKAQRQLDGGAPPADPAGAGAQDPEWLRRHHAKRERTRGPGASLATRVMAGGAPDGGRRG